MILYICLLLALASVHQGSGESNYSLKLIVGEGKKRTTLHSPPRYTVKATKIELAENIIEVQQSWVTETKSRIDYNNGAVTSIVMLDPSWPKGIRYHIHPEANLNGSSHNVCYYYNEGKHVRILPDMSLCTYVGDEEMNNKHTKKYKASGLGYTLEIWVGVLDNEYWYPVRIEYVEFNTKRGYKEKHEIWEYSDFSTNFSTQEVFDIKYKCQESSKFSKEVTENLIFMNPEDDDHVDHVFNTFKNNHGRNYTDEEHEYRRNIFQNNMRHIVAMNNRNLGYKLAINQFADRTSKEMINFSGLRRRRPASKLGTLAFPYTERKLTEMSMNLPKEYDLRLFGAVTRVKNQNTCGACSMFAATAVVEGALARIKGKLLTLAEQAVIDCAWPFPVSGCHGGSDINIFEWMMEYGLPTEIEYGAYKNTEGICNIKNMTKLYPIRGYTYVTPMSVAAMKIALINHGPLSVSVDASPSFHMYSSGIYYGTDCKQSTFNHGLAIVGYGERYGETFWILKNSWGPNWGVDGYMYMSAKDNVCGVASQPRYVVL